MNYNYLQQGGLTSLPTHPVLAGQPHELSYITPEEARMLRQQGGGVTPTGGQYRGPGGLPAFFGHGGHAQHGTPASVAAFSPQGEGLGTDAPPASETGKTPFGDMHAFAEVAMAESKEAQAKKDGMKSYLSFYNKGIFDLDGFKSHTKSYGFADGEMSKKNVMADALSRTEVFGDPTGFFGENQGFVNSKTGKEYSLGDMADADPSDFSGKGKFAGPEFGLKGDAYSPFGRLTLGLTDILGLVAPPIGLMGNILSLGKMAGLVDLPQLGDLGLMSLIGDIIGDISTGDDGSTVSSDLSNFGDRFAEVTGLQDVSDFSQGLISQAETAVDTAWSGSDLQAATQSVRSAVENVGEAVGEGISSIDLSLPNIDLGDWGFGDLSSVPQGEGGGPGIAMTSEPIEPPPPYVSPTFRNYPDRDPSESEVVTQVPTDYADILKHYIGSPTVTAQEGGGIQGLINNQNKEYSIRNQSNVPSFNKATPDPDLTSGSHGYISNILKGHTVPMGMTNVQQMQKPIEAFPTGGQMNTTNTQYADYSKPQSFYAMPNMNRIT